MANTTVEKKLPRGAKIENGCIVLKPQRQPKKSAWGKKTTTVNKPIVNPAKYLGSVD